ncbi:bifunctional 4-hydroxy-2-oxoglutarate aldolase/2-dehydro-3-deoxy-phosphogluconate aldolase [Diaminobutyricibacter sp. McL0608]|uniref:bifunctional 4-hydroxy-2-oxoglutarate aldolase/2-dehydro-3-deoxy-phosphogluconate aldolase n=1 Tax=Leifsonia sp. McL0608 TaxID=3143537 RepID=UPI0031F33212
MVILRGFDVPTTIELCHQAWDAGIRLVEIPLQNEESERALRAACAEAASNGLDVGAGTIVSTELADRAAAAGAAFTVAPGTDRDVLASSVGLGLPHLPGVGTASEVQALDAIGIRWVKAFPADALGPAWVKGILGPFPSARIVATGGIDGDNADAFLTAGAAAVSLGSSFAKLDRERLRTIGR